MSITKNVHFSSFAINLLSISFSGCLISLLSLQFSFTKIKMELYNMWLSLLKHFHLESCFLITLLCWCICNLFLFVAELCSIEWVNAFFLIIYNLFIWVLSSSYYKWSSCEYLSKTSVWGQVFIFIFWYILRSGITRSYGGICLI